MKSLRFTAVVLSGTAVWTIAAATPCRAQDGMGSTREVSPPDIVVTARRKSEVLQDVPQTINAVTSETIEKLRINNASDIQQVVPGISLESSTSGSGAFGSSSSIRGVPTFLLSNATPVVQFYMNEAPTGRGPEATSSLFDIGQIEVLKGPQGTLRGRSAPVGSITVTTRDPSMTEIGGYANMSGSHLGNVNVQGAIGIPLINDVLALRLAGVIDRTDANGVTSANNPIEPKSNTEAWRATLRFEPATNFNASIMFQRQTRRTRTFDQVAGAGNGVNGPAIGPSDRLGITDEPSTSTGHTNYLVGNAEWFFADQKLSYVGSYRDGSSVSMAVQDRANVIPGYEWHQTTHTPAKEMSHELRLSSDERIAGIFDYTVGAFFDREWSQPTVEGTAAFLSGAFGRPGQAPIRATPNTRYSLANYVDIHTNNKELSFFGSLTAHLGDDTELTAGGRYIHSRRDEAFSISTGPGFNAITNPLIPSPAFCGFLPGVPAGTAASPVYTGSPAVCDIPIAGRTIQELTNKVTYDPFIYNLSISHKFTPDLLVYATTGTSFRTAGASIGIQGVTTCCSAPSTADLGSFNDLIFHSPEKSTAYELGFKASFLDRRASLNVAVFRQKFKGFIYLAQSARYLSVSDPTNPAGGSVSSYEFTTNADAKVTGFDIEASFRPSRRWTVSAGFSWARAKLTNALIPCNDGNFDGVPDTIVPTVSDFINAGTMVARCRSSDSISRTPLWNLNLQSEYQLPISDKTDGFIRGNFNLYPDNPNASEGYVVQSYSLLNLFAGVRSADGNWEVSIFANNILKTQEVLAKNSVSLLSSGGVSNFFPGSSGYNAIAYTPRREVGVNVRYAFGSR